jgi:hypothetical protein
MLAAGTVAPELETELLRAGEDEFVRCVVVMGEGPDREVLERMDDSEIGETLRGIASTSQADVLDFLEGERADRFRNLSPYWVFNGFFMEATPSLIREVADRGDVRIVEPDAWVELYDVRGPSQAGRDTVAWGIRKIKADSAWMNGYTGEGILMGSLDTGVDHDHPALYPHWSGYWLDAVSYLSEPYDEHGHGTHTSGTMMGGDGLGPFEYDVGVAPGAELCACKAFTASGGYYSDILECMQFFASLKADSSVDVRVVNNSWGSDDQQYLGYWGSVANWRSLDIYPVFSIGNAGPGSGSAGTPGNYPLTLGVGATNHSDNMASFSSRGPAPDMSPWNDSLNWLRPDWDLIKPDISAPGYSIYSTVPGGGYANGPLWSGTSMASPHVAGVIALMLEKNPALTYEEIYMILTETAYQPAVGGPYPNNNYGWGRVDAKAAVEATPSCSGPCLTLTGFLAEDTSGGNLDPGEEGFLVLYMSNLTESTAVDVQGTLRSESEFVVLDDSTASFGDIEMGTVVDNGADPFIVSVTSGCPNGEEIPFSIRACSNGGAYEISLDFDVVVGVERLDYADVHAGDALLTVTDEGAVGYTNSDQTYGSGFRRPITNPTHLFYGTFALGNASDYVVDDWYESSLGDDEDWAPTVAPDGRLYYVEFPDWGDEMVRGIIEDSGHPDPKGVQADQVGFAFDTTAFENFVLVWYRIRNVGCTALDSLYAAYFMDFDIPDAYNNNAGIDTLLNGAYMWTGSDYAGICLVEPQEPAANLSVIENPIYVWPNEGMPDSVQWSFMNGDLHFECSTNDTDYSIVVSTGPFDLDPADSHTVCFAVIGADSLAGFNASILAAREAYEKAMGVQETITPDRIEGFGFSGVNPNPSRDRVWISFSLPEAGECTLRMYDVSGRVVRELFRGERGKGTHRLSWDGRDDAGRRVSQGLYFARLATESRRDARKVLILR